MSDIDSRLRRHRLSRYAPPPDPLHRGLRLGWVALGLWLVWIAVLSDHSLWRIWRLGREHAQTEQDLQRTRREVDRLDAELNNPATQREQAESALRRTGMAGPGEIVYRIREGAARPDTGAR